MLLHNAALSTLSAWLEAGEEFEVGAMTAPEK